MLDFILHTTEFRDHKLCHWSKGVIIFIYVLDTAIAVKRYSKLNFWFWESTLKNEKWNWLFFAKFLGKYMFSEVSFFINIMGKSHEISLFATVSHVCKGKNILCNHYSWLWRIFYPLQLRLTVAKSLISWDFPMHMAFWTNTRKKYQWEKDQVRYGTFP